MPDSTESADAAENHRRWLEKQEELRAYWLGQPKGDRKTLSGQYYLETNIMPMPELVDRMLAQLTGKAPPPYLEANAVTEALVAACHEASAYFRSELEDDLSCEWDAHVLKKIHAALVLAGREEADTVRVLERMEQVSDPRTLEEIIDDLPRADLFTVATIARRSEIDALPGTKVIVIDASGDDTVEIDDEQNSPPCALYESIEAGKWTKLAEWYPEEVELLEGSADD